MTRNLALASVHGDLIVRHLLLPGHFDCCFVPIIDWIAEQMPDVKFSLRDGYLPRWQAARDPELGRVVSRAEACEARRLALQRKLNLVT